VPEPVRSLGGPALRTLAAERLLTTARPSAREVGAAAVLLALVALAVFGPHVLNGGFMSDDWALQARWEFLRARQGFLPALLEFSKTLTSQRPLLAVYFGLTHELLGLRMGPHLAVALAMAVAMGILAYVVLRELGLPPVHAGPLAALVLLFPGADTTRLWAAASHAQVTIALYLAGTLLALRGLSVGGRRGWVLHASALVLYGLSVLFYEIALLAIAGSLLVYLCRAPLRRALAPWLLDLTLVALLAVLFTARPDTAHWEVQPLGEQLHNLGLLLVQGASVLGAVALPTGEQGGWPLVLLAVPVVAGMVAWRLLPRAHPAHGELRRWVIAAVLGLLLTVAAYAIFAPAPPNLYNPLPEGMGRRVNALPGVGMVVLVYAAIALAATLVTVRAGARGRHAATGLVALAGLGIAVSYAVTVRRDAGRWDRAYQRESAALTTMRRRLPALPRFTLIHAFGQPMFESPGITVFAANWDLDSAMRLTLRRPDVRTLPALPGASLRCTARSVVPANSNFRDFYTPADVGRYGHVVLVDSRTGDWALPRNRNQCRAALPRFVPAGFLPTG